jgi:trehalose synthase
MPPLEHVPVTAMDPHRFGAVLSPKEYEALLALIDHAGRILDGRVIWNVNSTAKGGGVVELLHPLLGYCSGVGVDARWVVISGEPDFFAITKRLHNHLHGVDGDGGALGDPERSVYERTLAANAEELVELVRPHDIVILHDPQTAGLVDAVRRTGAIVIWRCHIGLDHPNVRAREAWSLLRPYVLDADAYVFSRAAFAWEGLDRDKIAVIQPSIDIFSPKNTEQSTEQTLAILAAAGITDQLEANQPAFTRSDGTVGHVGLRAAMVEEAPLSPEGRLVAQVSRWDRLKDPLGVLRGFADHVAHLVDAHLLLAGPSTETVADDPEGAEVFATVRQAWEGLPAEVRRRVHLASLPMDDIEENAAIVNALQRNAHIVVQKSLAEGFGLTVAEAMWKSRPVVASRIGGIRDQIINNRSGLLVSNPRDLAKFGSILAGLLGDADRAHRIGVAAHSRVQHHFLGPHHLGRYFELVHHLIERRRATPAGSAAARSS